MNYYGFDEVFERFRYPAGESHLRLRPAVQLQACTVIEAKVRGFDELAQVVTADRVLRRSGHEAEWFIPYFPFARHDRRNDANDGFELGVALEMAREINITIADPHSDVAGQLRHIPQSSVVDCYRDAGVFDENPIIVIPDAGAEKKVISWTKPGDEVVQALKRRDPETGELSGFRVMADDIDERPCIVVDDICDGGGTFLGIAKELRAKNAGPLTLAVTHGLFTKGTSALLAAYRSIFSFSYAGGEVDANNGAAVITISFKKLIEKGQQR